MVGDVCLETVKEKHLEMEGLFSSIFGFNFWISLNGGLD